MLSAVYAASTRFGLLLHSTPCGWAANGDKIYSYEIIEGARKLARYDKAESVLLDTCFTDF